MISSNLLESNKGCELLFKKFYYNDNPTELFTNNNNSINLIIWFTCYFKLNLQKIS